MKRLRILAVDPIDPTVRTKLKKEFDVDQKTGLTKKKLIKIIGGYDAVIGRTSTKLDKDVLAAGVRLRCIGVHATGWDHIDIAEATRLGIAVLGYPPDKKAFKKERLEGSFIGAAEHVLLGMLAGAGNFYNTVDGMKAGKWEKYKFTGTELYGKTLGIIGLGRIGSLVAERAKAFGVKVVAYGPNLTAREAKERDAVKVSLPTLLKTSDFITLHIPNTPTTKGMVDRRMFKQMKKGVIFINTARAAIVNETDLILALKDGTIRMAVIDVFNHPPKGVNPKLVALPNVLATPHIAGVSQEGLSRVSTYIGGAIREYLKRGKAKGLINPAVQPRRFRG